jgi:hypothetical protein
MTTPQMKTTIEEVQTEQLRNAAEAKAIYWYPGRDQRRKTTEGAPRNKVGSRSVDGAGGTTSPTSRNTSRSRVSQDPPMLNTASAQLLNPVYKTGEQ